MCSKERNIPANIASILISCKLSINGNVYIRIENVLCLKWNFIGYTVLKFQSHFVYIIHFRHEIKQYINTSDFSDTNMSLDSYFVFIQIIIYKLFIILWLMDMEYRIMDVAWSMNILLVSVAENISLFNFVLF